MKTIIDYLNEIKTKNGIKSNLQLAALIGVSAAGIDGLMKGRITPSDERCVRIAELAGERPEVIITLAHATKAKQGNKKYWDKILKAITAAAFILLLSAFFLAPSPAQASTITADSVYYVKLIISAIMARFSYRAFLFPRLLPA